MHTFLFIMIEPLTQLYILLKGWDLKVGIVIFDCLCGIPGLLKYYYSLYTIVAVGLFP